MEEAVPAQDSEMRKHLFDEDEDEDWGRYITTEDGIIMGWWYLYTIDDIFWWHINNLR